jgi:hypothetical protein
MALDPATIATVVEIGIKLYTFIDEGILMAAIRLTSSSRPAWARTLVRVVAGAVLASGLALGAGTPAQAATPPGDDRLLSTPTGWWAFSGYSAQDVGDALNRNGARLTDLRVDKGQKGAWSFSGTMVANSGGYGVGWWWAYNQSKADLTDAFNRNNARPISVQKYWDSSQSTWRYVAVMVSNTGSNQRGWNWDEGTASHIDAVNTAQASAGLRLAGISSYVCTSASSGCSEPPGSHFVALYEQNTEGYTATFRHNLTASQLGSAASGGKQLVDLDPNNDGTFNAVINVTQVSGWVWKYNISSIDTLTNRAGQHGMRLTDVTKYWNGSSWRYAGVMVNNLSGENARLRDIYDSALPFDTAHYGFRLKQWNGPVVVQLQDDTQFDPMSVAKTIIHLHTMRNLQYGTTPGATGAVTDVTNDLSIPYRYKEVKYPKQPDSETGGCPEKYSNSDQVIVKDADTAMMMQSDNRMSHALFDFFKTHTYQDSGQTVTWPVQQTIDALGLTKTTLPLECSHNPPNLTTLREQEKVFEAGYLRTDILDTTRRNEFHDNMLTTSWSSWLLDMIADERDNVVGFTHDNDFDDWLWTKSMGKGGSSDNFDGITYRANGGIVAIPNDPYNDKDVTYYTFGNYYSVPYDSVNLQAMDDAHNKVWDEALRPIVHDALVKWKNAIIAHGGKP